MDSQTEKNTMPERTIASIDLPPSPDYRLRALQPNQSEILRQFTPDEQVLIRYRQQLLSSLASFIGKDFRIPVDLNSPGEGWHWDFQANRIAIDPKDLVEKPFDELRFIVSHEGGHRRISRMETIPLEEWQQQGFPFMVNAIEDPRVNNFVVEAYPRFADPMRQAYQSQVDFEAKAKSEGKDKLGRVPRSTQAGFEYIKQWFKESQGQEMTLSEDLPEEVRQVVEATLEHTRAAWQTYPSRGEANQGENVISDYAKASTGIMREKVWPEFKKLVEEDLQDQELQQALKDMQQAQGEGKQGTPQPLKDKLTEAEQKELEQAIEQAMQKGQDGQPQQDGTPQPGIIDLDTLSQQLQQKIKDYIDSLPEDVKRELAEKARQAFEEYEQQINEEMQGKLSDNPEKKSQREAAKPTQEDATLDAETTPTKFDQDSYEEQQRKFREIAEQALHKDESAYEKYRHEVLPVIDELENDLRELFVQRRANRWQGGYRSGKRVDIQRRIQEKAKGISAVESRAWQRRELPQEKDYAISLLVDLSGSMRGEKIDETFKAAIVLAEALNRLSIRTEILGFNDRLYEYQAFGQPMSRDVRDPMGGMLREVHDNSDTGKARWNDDGWALEQASARLAKQKESNEKFLFVLSDGLPAESPMHPRSKYELSAVVQKIMRETDQKLIGLGIGPGTDHVADYYPNSVADINVKEMAEKLADVIREAIANYQQF